MSNAEECAPAHSRTQPVWVSDLLKLAKNTFKAYTGAKIKEQITKNFADKEACYQHVSITALKS